MNYTNRIVCGTTGCVIAGRLATADSTLRILIIKSGHGNRDNPLIITLAIYLANLQPDSITIESNISTPQ